MSTDCLFCRIARGELAVALVYDRDGCIAFKDINPQAPVHVLVIPREHISSLNEATGAETVGRLSLAAAEIAREQGIADSGYRTVVNTHADAGQTVFHLHLHLLGGRRLSWPPG